MTSLELSDVLHGAVSSVLSPTPPRPRGDWVHPQPSSQAEQFDFGSLRQGWKCDSLLERYFWVIESTVVSNFVLSEGFGERCAFSTKGILEFRDVKVKHDNRDNVTMAVQQ